MIVKVQQSIRTNAGTPQVLIYNKSRKYEYEGDLPKDLTEVLGRRLKVFFKAKIVDNKFELIKEVKDKNW